MKHTELSCFINPHVTHEIRSYLSLADDDTVRDALVFHQSLPGYLPTPLVKLNSLAQKLGLSKISVKDESERFDLNAFKILGASYGVCRYLRKKLAIRNAVSFADIAAHSDFLKAVTFVTATDGNHGRAVAWIAQKLNCKAVVYLPKGSSPARLEAIEKYGAAAEITDLNYDDTVLHAERMSLENKWVLLQDTAWPGYEEIPGYIMQGYSTLVSEYLQQDDDWPTHILLQAGVGSFAAAVLARFATIAAGRPVPKCIVVEPAGAPCLYESMRYHNGNPAKIEGNLPTIMAGLACGEPSHTGIKILKNGAAAFLKCSDIFAKRGMKVLGSPLPGDQRIISGESGAVTLGLLYELYTTNRYANIKRSLEFNEHSKVLLFSTEGSTDPELYYRVVWS